MDGAASTPSAVRDVADSPHPPAPRPDQEESDWDSANLQMGSVASLTETAHRKHTPIRHLHPGPLGFALPDQKISNENPGKR